MNERLSLIWGPPCTGKTFTLAAIVDNWLKQKLKTKILICAPSNYAADLITERFYYINKL
jgi:hypothetical protein